MVSFVGLFVWLNFGYSCNCKCLIWFWFHIIEWIQPHIFTPGLRTSTTNPCKKSRTGSHQSADIHIDIYFPVCLSFLLLTLSSYFFFIMFLLFSIPLFWLVFYLLPFFYHTLFFQNVKFCSRTIPVFLYVRLCHVPRDSGLLPNEKIRIQTLYCQMKHGRRGPTDRRLNIYVPLNINILSHKHFIIGVLFYNWFTKYLRCFAFSAPNNYLFFFHAYITKYLQDLLPIRYLNYEIFIFY